MSYNISENSSRPERCNFRIKDLNSKKQGWERWWQVEQWLKVGVGKKGGLDQEHLERSTKPRKGGRWDVSANDRP